MGYLKQVDVENFKSWRGKQIIGPFMRFSCIIGTNGSGKSNVMDAISFAIGERCSSLRVKHLRDLIHGAHIGHPVSSSAAVCLRYCDNQDEETAFTRTITGDSSEYYINGVHMTLSQYLKQLEKIGILIKAQNCLVFQGAVETIALKDPKERTKMFESISQSRELVSEYERKKKAMLQAKEDTQFHFNKKKSTMVEKRQALQEKQEAEKYQALLDELQQNRLQLSLTRLYHSERSINALSDSLKTKQQAAATKHTTVLDSEQEVKAQKKEHGRLTREQQQLDKEIRVQEHALSQCRSEYIKANVSTSHHKKKVEDNRKSLKKAEQLLVLKEQELSDGRQELSELEEVWRCYETQAQKQQATRVIQLDQDQLERYTKLKERFHLNTAILNQQSNKLLWEITADQQNVALDQHRRKEVEAGIRAYQNQLEDVTHRAEKLEEYTNVCRLSIEQHREQEEALSSELQRGRDRDEVVKKELGAVLQELQTAQLETRESERQLQSKEILQKLQRLYPDSVYGRLSDLCSPVRKKYQLAVTKVLGRNMNAIVVDSEKVARDCISFIKQVFFPPETFLPVDYLKVLPLNERLRELPGAKMVVDIVQVNPPAIALQLKKVIQHVCGNTLVFETIEEARHMAFNEYERRKTVSLDGTLFTKSGVISGGSSHLRSKARCWDDKDVRKLKERKEQLMKDMSDLVKLRRKESDLRQIQTESQGIQTRLKYSSTDLELLRKKTVPRIQADISRLESSLLNLDSETQMQEENLKVKEEKLKTIRDKIDQIEQSVFADFCEEIGVESISEFEQEHLEHHTERAKKRLELESQMARLSAQLEYKETELQHHKKKLQQMQETIDKDERVVEEQTKDEQNLLAVVEEGQKKVLDLKNQLLSKKSQASAAKTELDLKLQKLQETNKELVKLQREVMTEESKLEQKRLFRHNLLLDCKIQGLPITLLSGDITEVLEVQLGADSESTLSTAEIYEREAQLIIDFSVLREDIRSLREEKELEFCLNRLRDTEVSLEEVLSNSVTPNLKATGKITQLKEKLQDIVEAFEASSRAARKYSQEFEEVKGQRGQLFSQCFEHVCVNIEHIYKRICRNSGAQAILTAENTEEPYLGGISFNCVAPGKRFMSMENLSGGEKVLAALALVFAIHSYRPAPFLILDEVDAALDNSNIGKVTSFMREESTKNLQIIVISLKEEFYSKADALLGIYSDLDEQIYSRILTLDLRPYPLADDDNNDDSSQMSPRD